jgi:TonB family protein
MSRAMRRVLIFVVALAIAAIAWPISARAQPAPPPPAAATTPPVLKQNEGAAYPQQALDEGMREPVTVVLVLEIDATGIVKHASVPTPVGHGFDEAAVAAASKLVFEPATRDGKPVAARIRFRYTFTPPAGALAGRVSDRATGAPIAGAQVTVRAPDGKEATTTTGPDGTWSMKGLAAGKYAVTVVASGFETTVAEEAVDPGKETRITERLGARAVAPLDAGAGAEAGADAGARVAAPPEPIQTIEVAGEKPPREVTKRTLEQREMERIPGTNGDALRSLQNLPGVARAPGLAGLLIVRGSAPQDTNVFVDGTLIPIVYHFGGLSSVVPTEILNRIDFYPGNFSTQYGRVMGGVVDVGIRDPKSDRFHALAQADFIDARVLAEGPIFDTGWKFAVGARRSYVDVWLKPALEASGAGVTTAPVYYDYQAMVERDFSSRSSLRILFMGSDDRLDILTKTVGSSEPAIAGGISTATGFWRLQARYRNKIDDKTELKITSAVGEDYIAFDLGDNFFHVDTYPITTRAEITHKLGRGVTTNWGIDFLDTPYDVAVRFPPFPRPGEPPGGPFLSRPPLERHNVSSLLRPGIYNEWEIVPWHGGRLVPGMRLDYASDAKSWDLAPRFVARQDIHSEFPRTTAKGGAGVFFQPPQPQETDPVFGKPGIISSRAIHYDVGGEQEITRNIEVSLEGFYKQMDRLVVAQVGNIANGRAFGAELLLRYKPDERFFGWLAYTLSRSERRDAPGDPIRLSAFDQTHILTVLGSYRLGRGWEFGARFRLVSGNRYTPNMYGFYDENSGVYLPLANYPPNGSRLPMFHQLDVRVDKSWLFKSGMKLSMYLDVQNVYNNGNVEGISYNYNYTLSTYATGLPIIPSFGMRVEY